MLNIIVITNLEFFLQLLPTGVYYPEGINIKMQAGGELHNAGGLLINTPCCFPCIEKVLQKFYIGNEPLDQIINKKYPDEIIVCNFTLIIQYQ